MKQWIFSNFYRLIIPVMLCIIVGCVATEKQRVKTINLNAPKSTGGILVKDPETGEFDRLIEQLEAQRDPKSPVTKSEPDQASPVETAQADVPEELGLPYSKWPQGAGRLFDLPKLNDVELGELLNDIVLNFQTNKGFQEARDEIAAVIPNLPPDIEDEVILSKDAEEGIHILRIGYWTYKARPPRLGVYTALLNAENVLITRKRRVDTTVAKTAETKKADSDVGQEPSRATDEISIIIERTLHAFNEMRQNLTYQDLEHEIVSLSYIDATTALEAMKGMGITAIKAAGEIPKQIQFADLPIAVELPSPKAEDKGLVGKGRAGKATVAEGGGKGAFGASIVPTVASELSPDMIASPTDRILVLYHPARPEQFSRVQTILREIIDRPARQIFVEAMVLEISQAHFQELGIEWQFQNANWDLMFGSLDASLDNFNNMMSTAALNADRLSDFSYYWNVKIRALVIDGKAEILSRPSILALNNRQATIRVGRDIPIATSQEGLSGNSGKLSFDFQYIPLGILLNIRPRISDNDKEVSLMVDTVVSSEVPGGDLEIRDTDGQLLASAPTINTRRVQTYARIENNTPFIIGGLVSTDKTVIYEKVPFLGDLPILGYLFRSENIDDRKNEVIIVLTPYILPEKTHMSRVLPKENALMNDSDSLLFRDSYRISPEDILDVSFLYRNEQFQAYRQAAMDAMNEDFSLAEQDPFYSFSDGRLPGEKVLVNKILYNAVERLELNKKIDDDGIYILTSHSTGGYEVDYLSDLLKKLGDGQDPLSFFEVYPDKAIAFSFNNPLQASSKNELINDPIPVISVLECPDRKTWHKLMWEMNNSQGTDKPSNTIILHRPEDLDRLRSSLMAKFVLELNGGRGSEASLLKFVPGRYIEVPELQGHHTYMLNAETARHFFHSTQHYYAETIRQINEVTDQLDEQLDAGVLRDIQELSLQ